MDTQMVIMSNMILAFSFSKKIHKVFGELSLSGDCTKVAIHASSVIKKKGFWFLGFDPLLDERCISIQMIQ